MPPSSNAVSAGRKVKRYYIEVRGFDGHYVEAETAGKARYRDFIAYEDAGYGIVRGERRTRSERFREFLARIEVFHHHGAICPTPPPETGTER